MTTVIEGNLALKTLPKDDGIFKSIKKRDGRKVSLTRRKLRMPFLRQPRQSAVRTFYQYNLNYSLIATPAEGLSGRFLRLDRNEFGVVEGVTDKEFYTNSFHVPVNFPISSFDKINLEGPYHEYCNAGHISYVEMSAPPINNLEAVERIIRHIAASDMGYAGINFPVDFCKQCSHQGLIIDKCPNCSSTNIKRVRRITGYLSTTERFGESKIAELSQRTAHDFSLK